MHKKSPIVLLLAIVFALLLPLGSCNERNKQEPQSDSVFRVSSASFDRESPLENPIMSFSAENGIAYIDFESSEPWKATHAEDWFSVSPEKGNPGAIRIAVSVESNSQETPRKGKLVLEAKDSRIEIIVFQQKLYKGDISTD